MGGGQCDLSLKYAQLPEKFGIFRRKWRKLWKQDLKNIFFCDLGRFRIQWVFLVNKRVPPKLCLVWVGSPAGGGWKSHQGGPKYCHQRWGCIGSGSIPYPPPPVPTYRVRQKRANFFASMNAFTDWAEILHTFNIIYYSFLSKISKISSWFIQWFRCYTYFRKASRRCGWHPNLSIATAFRWYPSLFWENHVEQRM